MAKAIVRTEVEAKLGGACKAIENQIKRIEAQIKIDKRRLDQRIADLKKLESKPKPDTAQINAMKRIIKELGDRLSNDEEGLSQLQVVFSENCRS